MISSFKLKNCKKWNNKTKKCNNNIKIYNHNNKNCKIKTLNMNNN